MAQIWVNHQRPILDAQTKRPDQILQIYYEDLLTDPNTVLKQVFDWLEVDSGDPVIAESLSATSFSALTDGRQPGEENRDSFFRKGTAGQWRSGLSEEQQAQFWEIAGETMTAQGYDASGRAA